MIPTVLLMFLSNDADLESLPSMLQWPIEPVETEAGVPRQLPPMMPLLCTWQTKQTVGFLVVYWFTPCQSEDFFYIQKQLELGKNRHNTLWHHWIIMVVVR